jgi:hypothetical protein
VPEQYAANDKRTGLEVALTGEFPPLPDDRIRIARTTNLFTRLMSTILSTENETERRQGFQAVEMQLEMADAMIRQDMAEVQSLVRQALEKMGVTDEQLRQVEEELRKHLGDMGEGPVIEGDPPPTN